MKTYKIRKRVKLNKTKKNFLFNPHNPAKSFDVYIDKNPKDTIPIKYTTLNDVKKTISTLEKLYKSKQYSHKRIWQVGMILYVRLKVLKKIKPIEYELASKYFKFLKHRTSLPNDERYRVVPNLNL
jgi:hypothetical protein